MEGEKGARQEEVVQRVQIEVAQRIEDEHQKEEKEQGDGSEVADLSGQGTGLQLFRHGHADLKSRQQIGISPRELPPVRGALLLGGRERVVGEVDVFEIRRHAKHEVVDVCNAVAQFVAPTVQTLGAVCSAQRRGLAGSQHSLDASALFIGRNGNFLAVDFHHQPVVDGTVRREGEVVSDNLGLGGIVAELVFTGKVNRVGRIPQQTLLAMIKLQLDADLAGVKLQGKIALHLVVAGADLSRLLLSHR